MSAGIYELLCTGEHALRAKPPAGNVQRAWEGGRRLLRWSGGCFMQSREAGSPPSHGKEGVSCYSQRMSNSFAVAMEQQRVGQT